jgi:hypothetical protein
MKVYNDFGHVTVLTEQVGCHLTIALMPSNVMRFIVSNGINGNVLPIGDVVLGTDDWWYVNDPMYGGA